MDLSVYGKREDFERGRREDKIERKERINISIYS